jgi:mannose-6-phosphate isomerase-like protein (cupin superfamily)
MPKKGTLKTSDHGSAELGLAPPDSVQNISEQANSSEGIPREAYSLSTDSAKTDSAKTSSVQAPPAHLALVSRDNAEHYRWGDDCDGWHLVKNKQLSVIEEFMPPGAAEVRHHHERSQQFFYILTGEVLMEINGENMLIPAGRGIRIPPGTRHQVRNPSSGPVRFLVVSQPPSHGDRIDD